MALARGDVAGAEGMFRTAVDDGTPAWHSGPSIGFGGGSFRPALAMYWLGVATLRRADVERGIRLLAAGRPAVEQGEVAVAAMYGRRRGDDTVAEARAAVPPERFAALWAEGEAMTQEEAIAYALQEPAAD